MRYKDPDRRRAYMREYMRRRRKIKPDVPHDPCNLAFASARLRARKYDRPFTITIDDVRAVWARSDGLCELSGLPFQRGGRGGKQYSPTLDRIDNNSGYEPHNIWLILKGISSAKRDRTLEQLFTSKSRRGLWRQLQTAAEGMPVDIKTATERVAAIVAGKAPTGAAASAAP